MRVATILLLGGLGIAAVGCGSKASSAAPTARVAFSAGTTAKAAAAPAAALDGGNGLAIDRIRVVVRRVEVEASDATCPGATGPTGPTGPMAATPTPAPADPGSQSEGPGESGQDESGGSTGECEFGGGPFLVDLSGATLTGGIHWVATVDVPAGTYEKVKFDINTIPAALAGTDAGLKEMADAHASIIVDGTVGGGAFTFSTPIEVEQEREGAITIDGSTTNLTLDVDPSGWFKAADGTLLSPNDPTANGAILANIRASIRIVHDDDHDGRDDEHDGS